MRLYVCLIWGISLLVPFSNLNGQRLSPDEVITKPLYGSRYRPLEDAPERSVAKALEGLTLEEMVDADLIRRENMAGLALPLGVFKYPGPVDLRRGMVQMWDAKARWAEKKGLPLHPFLMRKALQLSIELQEPGYSLSLRDYREMVLERVVEDVQGLHQRLRPDYTPERQAFMDMMVDNFSANVMLGYNIQELIPPYHFVPPVEKRINPLFKAYYLDRLFREGGALYVAGFPARYDTLISFGPFQLTQRALDDLQANQRLLDDFREFKQMRDLVSLNDHARAAAFYAYNNLERLSMSLKNAGEVTRLTRHFEKYESDPELKRELQIFLAGIIACMHHQPGSTRGRIKAYLDKHKSLDEIHLEPVVGNAQLEKYYDSAARAYLIMKVYHTLIPE